MDRKHPVSGPGILAGSLFGDAMTVSAFERLGIVPAFHIDDALLLKNYLHQSRLCHPDHNAQSGPEALEKALVESTSLNEAYAVLANPLRRAEHLLALWGGPDASTNKSQPMPFLEQMLEWREEAKDPATHPRLRIGLETERTKLLNHIQQQFSGPEEDALARLIRTKEIRLLLNQLRSVEGLLRELEDSY